MVIASQSGHRLPALTAEQDAALIPAPITSETPTPTAGRTTTPAAPDGPLILDEPQTPEEPNPAPGEAPEVTIAEVPEPAPLRDPEPVPPVTPEPVPAGAPAALARRPVGDRGP